MRRDLKWSSRRVQNQRCGCRESGRGMFMQKISLLLFVSDVIVLCLGNVYHTFYKTVCPFLLKIMSNFALYYSEDILVESVIHLLYFSRCIFVFCLKVLFYVLGLLLYQPSFG